MPADPAMVYEYGVRHRDGWEQAWGSDEELARRQADRIGGTAICRPVVAWEELR